MIDTVLYNRNQCKMWLALLWLKLHATWYVDITKWDTLTWGQIQL